MNILNKFIEKIFLKFSKYNEKKKNIEKLKINQGKLLSKNLKNCTLDNIHRHSFSIYSQFDEDGILQFLIENLEIKNNTFVEIGVENYEEANTRFLLENNLWSGLIIDSSKDNINFVKKQNYYWRYNLQASASFVTKENINKIIKKYIFEENIGLLSIDIDGNDYWIWQAISVIKPDILILEYNSLFGKERSLTLKYDESFIRPSQGLFRCMYGASLKALTDLSKVKGYSLVSVNSNGNNAFYVRNEILNDKIYKKNLDECFKKNTFKEHISSNGEIKKISNIDLEKILNSEKIQEV
jgi:hypothetical protein